jgi:hypothetical protein
MTVLSRDRIKAVIDTLVFPAQAGALEAHYERTAR